MTFDLMERPTTNAALLAIELLRGSLENLPKDHEAATQLITRACSVLESAGSPTRSATVDRGGLAPWQIRKVKAYIDENIARPMPIAEISQLVRLGPSHFQRSFKKSLGVSPHAFVMQRRVHRAQTLMLTTQEALSAIALTVGFSDQAHFTTQFRRATGVTPGKWRRERQGFDDTRRHLTHADARAQLNSRADSDSCDEQRAAA